MDNLIIIEEGTAVIAPEAAEQISEMQKNYKKLEEAMKEIKSRLYKEMEAKDILKIDMPNLIITLVPATTTEKIDSKTLKKELPEIFNAYATEGTRDGYVKLIVRD